MGRMTITMGMTMTTIEQTGIARLGAALALAVGAEALHFFAGDRLAWNGCGLARRGGRDLARRASRPTPRASCALRRGQLNINALMWWPSPAPS